MDESRPESITTKEEVVVGSPEKRLQTMAKRLVQHSLVAAELGAEEGAVGSAPVDFFSMVVDPDSFTQTVENIFDLSFLVRQGTAALAVAADTGLPVVSAVEAQPAVDQRSSQLVVALCPADVRAITAAFRCTGHRTDPINDEGYDGSRAADRARNARTAT